MNSLDILINFYSPLISFTKQNKIKNADKNKSITFYEGISFTV